MLEGGRAEGGPAAPSPAASTDEVPHEVWERGLGGFLDASYDQSATYAAGKWGAQRVSACRVTAGGTVLGGAIVVMLSPPGIGRGVAYIKFGPVWRDRGAAADPARYRAVVAALVEEYAVRRGHMLTIRPRPHPEVAPVEYAALAAMGFRLRPQEADRNRYLVDLSLDEAAQAASLSQKWRYNLRQAWKKGVTVAEFAGPAGAAEVGRLHRQTVARKGFRDEDNFGVLPAMAERLPPGLAPRSFLASAQGRPVAGAVVGVLGDTAYYLYGASGDEALPLRAGYALQWGIVAALRGSGARWYDLGGDVGETGLRQFKAGLAGSAGAVHAMPGEFHRWSEPLGRLAGEAVFAARAVAGRFRSRGA